MRLAGERTGQRQILQRSDEKKRKMKLRNLKSGSERKGGRECQEQGKTEGIKEN